MTFFIFFSGTWWADIDANFFKSMALKILVVPINDRGWCRWFKGCLSLRFSGCIAFKGLCNEPQHHKISQVSFQVVSVLLHISCNNINNEMWKYVADSNMDPTHVSLVSTCVWGKLAYVLVNLAQVLKKKTSWRDPSTVCLLPVTLQREAANVAGH